MKIFKNSVGRPSNETIKRRKTIIFFIVIGIIAIVGIGLLFISSRFSKNGSIFGSNKNSNGIMISFSDYNTTSPTPSQKVTFKHTVTNAKNYYQKWFTYTGSTITGRGDCEKLTTNNYEEKDSLTETKGQKKYLRVSIYSDSNCSNIVTTKDSEILEWKNQSTPTTTDIAITFSGFNTTTPLPNQKVTFKHTITNAKNYYQKWYTYTGSSITGRGSCQKLSTDNYEETDSLTGTNGQSKFYRVTIYSDSSCTKKVTTSDTQVFEWKNQSTPTTTDTTITFSGYNTTNPTPNQKVTFKHTVTNGKNYYQNWFTYTDGSITGRGNCQKISTDNYEEPDSLTGKNGQKKYLRVTIYSDSSCSKIVTTKDSEILEWKNQSTPSTASTTITFSGYNTLSPTPNQKVTFKHTVTNGKNYYQNWFTYTDGSITGRGSCQKLSTDDYEEADMLTGTNGQTKFLRVTIYSDSKCSKIVTTKDSEALEWKNTVYTDKGLTATVRKILSDNGLTWYNTNQSCAAAGIDDNVINTNTKIACIAYSQVGRASTNCCEFVLEVYRLAGKPIDYCYQYFGLDDTGSMGQIAQWGNRDAMIHVAIYINDDHVINGNWDRSISPRVADKTLSETKSVLYDFKGFHN